MLPWRGVVIHAILITAQPIYLTLRFLLNHQYFSSGSVWWFTTAAIVWIYIITQLSVPFFTSPLRHLPSPPGEKFPIGHLNFNGGKPPTQLLSDMFQTPNDGLLVLWMPFYLRGEIVATRPDTLMEIINAHSYDWEKPGLVRKILGRVVGEGLVFVEGDRHKSMRRTLTPSFSGRQIRNLVPLFYQKGVAFANTLATKTKHSTNGSLEMTAQMSRVTLDIIAAAGVGMDFNTVESDQNRLANLYATIVHTDRSPVWLFMLITLLIPPWIIRCMKGTRYATIENAQLELRTGVRALLQEKKQIQLNKAEPEKDIIATIMASSDLSDDNLLDQMQTFLAAGHDTTASALTWTMSLLSANPHIQDRLRSECEAQLSNKTNSEIDAATFDAETMPYLTAVCNECLRIYPPAPAIGRHAVRTTRVGNVIIPKGSSALLALWVINRSPDFWGPDANEFNPDRWLTGPNAAIGGATSPHAFTTFLHGPRSCIAQNFARAEMKCLLAAVVTRFRFELTDPDKKVEIGGFLTIKPLDGLHLKLHDLKAENGGM